MAMRISPWLQSVAERQVLKEFEPANPRIGNIFRRVLDELIHFFAQRFYRHYVTHYSAERDKRQPPIPDSPKLNVTPPANIPLRPCSASKLSLPSTAPLRTLSGGFLLPNSEALPKLRPNPTSSANSSVPEETKKIKDRIVSGKSFSESFISILTLEILEHPVISLSDCHVYENEDIETAERSWYDNLPFDDLTYCEDSLVLDIIQDPEHKIPNCPLTNSHFTEPFYCVEDGHTYDKKAILDWASKADRVPLGLKDDNIVYGISTPFHQEQDLSKLTLIPHALIFKALDIKLPSPLRDARCVVEIGEAGKITEHPFKGNLSP